MKWGFGLLQPGVDRVELSHCIVCVIWQRTMPECTGSSVDSVVIIYKGYPLNPIHNCIHPEITRSLQTMSGLFMCVCVRVRERMRV